MSCREGDWIAVPLSQGYAIGRVVLLRPMTSSMFVRFVPQRFEEPLSKDALERIRASDAAVAMQCSDAPLRDQAWRVLAGVDSYDVSKWPIPWFSYIDDASKRYWLLKAQRPGSGSSEDRIRRASREEAAQHPANVVHGRRETERALEERLSDADSFEAPS